MDDRTRRELRMLRVHALVTTPLILVLSLGAFARANQKTAFDEIDVQRINVREPDGKLRLIISNKAKSSGPIAHGKPFAYPGGTRPGIIFFNDEETENGGLTFSGQKSADGKVNAVGHLSFDQFDQDQVVYLQYIEGDGRRRMGLTVADRAEVPIYEMVAQLDSLQKLPDGPAKTEAIRKVRGPVNGVPQFAPRLYAGRDHQKAAIVNLSDPMGRTRLRMLVDSLGAARIEFLDEKGDGRAEDRVTGSRGLSRGQSC
jgi:hypothetical protein